VYIDIEDLFSIHSELSEIGVTLFEISWGRKTLDLAMDSKD